MTNPPMDWYPDPADAQRERYWDGTQWTHNTRPARPVAPAAPPAGGSSTAPQPQSGPGGQPQWGPQVDPRFQPQGQSQPQGQFQPQGQVQPWPPQAPGNGGPGYAYPVSAPGSTMTRDGVPTAGWWQRVGAYLLDSLLTSLLAMAVGWHWLNQFLQGFNRFFRDVQASAQAGNTTPPTTSPDMLNQYGLTEPLVWLSVVGTVVSLLYFAVQWALRGQTVGMSVLGIRVVPTDQGTAPKRLGWGRALRRILVIQGLSLLQNIPAVGPLLGLAVLVNYLMPLWTEKRQCLHDMAAGTQVVRSR